MKPGRKDANRIRIIGGAHRGRRLAFPDLPGLRPTGDRVRETLFNWLQPVLAGARCLDLFAGSGALGLEAASRGAGLVVLLDRAPRAVRQLQAHIAELGLNQARAEQADALAWLDNPPPETPFDIVFVDPPFDSGLAGPCCERLEKGGWLTPHARVYLETDVVESPLFLPSAWQVLREKRAGRVAYRLLAPR